MTLNEQFFPQVQCYKKVVNTGILRVTLNIIEFQDPDFSGKALPGWLGPRASPASEPQPIALCTTGPHLC